MTLLRFKNKSTTSLAYAKVYEPRASRIDRLVEAYWARPWMARVLFVLGCTLMAAAIVAAMYSL